MTAPPKEFLSMPVAKELKVDTSALYVGVSENAVREREFLRRAGTGIQTIVPEVGRMLDGCDLSTRDGVKAWAKRLRRNQDAVVSLLSEVQVDSVDDRWQSATSRVFYARLVSAFAGTSGGGRPLLRLVLSGHHTRGTDWLFGTPARGGLDRFYYSTIETIVGMFPSAAGQVHDLMLSACRSLGGGEALRLRLLFPNLRSAWGYAGTSPATPERASAQSAAKHIARWLQLTADGNSKIPPAAIKRLRHVKVLMGADVWKLQTYREDDQ